MKLEKIFYKNLNNKQKENYNFHKVASKLTEYGFNSMRLNDDWKGADFISVHIDGEQMLKVQMNNPEAELRGIQLSQTDLVDSYDNSCTLFNHPLVY